MSSVQFGFRASAAEAGVKPGQSQSYKPTSTVWELVCSSELVPLPASLQAACAVLWWTEL